MKTIKLIGLTLLVSVLSTMIVAEANAKTVLRKVAVELVTPSTEAMAVETYDGEFIPVDLMKNIGNHSGNAWKAIQGDRIELKTGEILEARNINFFYATIKAKAIQVDLPKGINERAPRDDE
ncbi:hypothetical protein M899_0243 [Bacteriovorax sp. BSW11_IV]|uniref:hypothetical protein n=1 Tax=Bacteriovorax sp. BSW11_IV TaxID=1353529 RepID=UPI000389F1E2|nr:hypothetical protein [Bacteriovorax sp. BSW11_IV]EQC48186.1 hypothetical protein M899_0243 [Bacteriovorax sp. BSW11_IV]